MRRGWKPGHELRVTNCAGYTLRRTDQRNETA
jgi:hypothetical protein